MIHQAQPFNPEPIKAVISDLMCTLFNPGISEDSVAAWARHLNLPNRAVARAMSQLEIEAGIGLVNGRPALVEDWMRLLLEQSGLEVTPEAARRYAHKLGTLTAKGGQLYPLVHELIKAIRQQRRFAILSTVSPRGRLAAKNLGLDVPWVDQALFSSEIGDAKPSLAVYRLACQKLAVKPRAALFIDDHVEYALAAKLLGITSVVVLHPEGHTAGLIKAGLTSRRKITAQGIICIDRIDELGLLLALPNWPPEP